MKAAIYNPYLDTLGGGERYTLFFAKVLTALGYKVDVEWQDPSIIATLEKRFGVALTNITTVDDIKRGDGYEVCFWVSDGSIPTLRSRNNFLHFQMPFVNVGGRSLINKMKLFRVKKVICNSHFTKRHIDKEYGVDSMVIYPPVDTEAFKSQKKQNVILYVGRFSTLAQSKNQDVLINSFKLLVKAGVKNWKLVLAGGTEVGVGKHLEKLKKLSLGFPIQIVENPTFSDLVKLNGRSKIFWSASGLGVDERKNPTGVEHFGISVVEAMSSGAIPIVYNAGGHKEIIQNGENGFLWNKKSGLVRKTFKIIKNQKFLTAFSSTLAQKSRKFSYTVFSEAVKALL